MMKKITQCILLFIMMMTSLNLQAQEMGFGLKGGLNLTTLDVSDPNASYESRTGYHAGIFLRGKFNKIGIQPEVLLFTHSNHVDYLGGLGTVDQHFTYLSIPLILKFYPVGGLNLQVGPQFGFLLDGEQEHKTLVFTGKRDIKDYYKNSDVSVSAGAGWDFGFGLNIDFRYNIGVKDINNVAGGEEAKSRVFLVSLGWNFVK